MATSLRLLAADQELENHVLEPGINEIIIEQSDGLKRQVLIEVPFQKSEGGHPVVFGFHGAGGKNIAWHRRLSRFVYRDGIISVSPQGGESRPRRGVVVMNFIPKEQTTSLWNFKKNSRSDADDIALIHTIIEILQNQNLVDMDRIYATGDSSGGLMAYRLAKETDLFAAIAPKSSGMAKDAHEPQEDTAKISLMQVIGDEDQSFYGLKSGDDEMYPLVERMKIWTEFSQCGDAVIEQNNESTTIQYNCAENKELVFMILKGVGHNLGKWVRPTDSLIMDFFLRQSKNNSAALERVL